MCDMELILMIPCLTTVSDLGFSHDGFLGGSKI